MQGKILRPEQLKRLEIGTNFPLTLLVAPAGCGKSELLNQWKELDRSGSIISLDMNTQPVGEYGLFKELLSALKVQGAILDAATYALFNHEQNMSEHGIFDIMMSAFMNLPSAITIMVDDFHLIESKATQSLFYSLVMAAPAHVRFIVASRHYPDFPLSRLKLKDLVFVLDGDDLKLTAEEAHELNENMGGKPIDAEKLQVLIAHTQGWFVGVKLALLAYQKRGVIALDSFSGSQPELINYFGYEVLSHLSEKFKRFLLLSSMFEIFSGEICEHVLGLEDCETVLMKLASQELFMTPDENRAGYYRYHPLLQEFLIKQISLYLTEAEVLGFHKVAAKYFLDRKQYTWSLRHAKYCKDSSLYFYVFQSASDYWIRLGCFQPIINFSEEIEGNLDEVNDGILINVVYAYIFSRRFNQAHYYIELLRNRENHRVSDHEISHVDFLDKVLQLFQHEDHAFKDQCILLESIHHSQLEIRSFSTLLVAYQYMYLGRLSDAFQMAHQAKAYLEKSGHVFLESYADLIIISCDRHLGRGIYAAQGMQQTFSTAKPPHESLQWLNLATGMMVVHYEKNELKIALSFCEQLLPLVNYICATEVVTSVYLFMSRLLHHRGEQVRASQILTQLERILALGKYGRFQSEVVQEKMRQCLQDEQYNQADRLYHQNQLHLFLKGDVFTKLHRYEQTRERYALASVYWLSSQQQYSAAKKILDQLILTLNNLGMKFRSLIAQANRIVIESQEGHMDTAIKTLKQLLDGYGLVCFSRGLFDETPGLGKLMQSALSSGRLRLPKQFLKAFDDVLNIPEEMCVAKSLVLLTEKEHEIFNLLGGGLSNVEISERAGIALSTTKWHIKNIYAKLGLENRGAAVLMASKV